MTVTFQYDGLVNTHHTTLQAAIVAFKNMISDFDIRKLMRKVGDQFIHAVPPVGSDLYCVDTDEHYKVTKSDENLTHYNHVSGEIGGKCHTNEIHYLFKVKVATNGC